MFLKTPKPIRFLFILKFFIYIKVFTDGRTDGRTDGKVLRAVVMWMNFIKNMVYYTVGGKKIPERKSRDHLIQTRDNRTLVGRSVREMVGWPDARLDD